MKKLIAVSVLVLFSFSCSTMVPVEVMKPSEVNMGSMKKIAILYFGYPDLGYGDATAEMIIRNTIGRYLGYAYNKSPEQEAVAKYATDKFITMLANTNYFTIIDSSNIEGAIIRTNKINLAPTELGEVLGTDALITGSITYLDARVNETKKESRDAKGVVTYTITYMKIAELSVSYRVLDAKSGQLVAAKQFKGKKEATGSDYAKLPDTRKMYQEILDDILRPLPHQLVPYKVTEYRSLMGDKSKNREMEKLDELVKKKFYHDALAGYRTIWQETGNVAAGYNAAIMLEITGDIHGAIDLMTEVAGTTKNERALQETDRLKTTKQEMEAAARQM